MRPRRTLPAADAGRALAVGGGRTRLMGVLNVTPDSFSDGGRFVSGTGVVDVDRAVATGLALADQGADVLDLGGESTRPGYEPVPPAVQIDRIVPVVRGLRAGGLRIPISIDTTRAEVAEAALEAGADWINDTTAFTEDPRLRDVAAGAGCPVVLMHRFDPPRPLDAAPDPGVVAAIASTLKRRADEAVAAGIDAGSIVLDPGLGFGTSHADCLALHRDPTPLQATGGALLYGASRKRFLGHLVRGERPAAERDFATAASTAALAAHGIEILRVHAVAAMRDVLDVLEALRPH